MPDNVDDIRLEGDANDLVQALAQAAEAWNRYNQNLKITLSVQTQVADNATRITRSVKARTQSTDTLTRSQNNLNRSVAASARHARLNNQELKTAHNRTVAYYRAVDQAASRTRRLAQNTKAAAKSSGGLTISLQSMTRLVGVQLIHRAIAGIANALREGTREAIEIQKALSEVRTISQNNQQSLDQWYAGVQKLSNVYGADLKQQIEGTYQALSNQVVEGAEAFKFLANSNDFAAATVSTTAESVQLLTAALNSYGIETKDTDKVAAQFFKTIELGRVRASEMANSFGDVAILASQAGVGLDELQAAVSTLTIRGVAYNKAATQLRGIFVKLLKPTAQMKQFFREIGVESGEAAIKAFGFDGVLRKLQESTGGSATELAKYINRIRGLSGALALSNEGLDQYVENLNEIRDATKSYNQAVNETLENSGKKADILVTNIKNGFLGLGRDIIDFYTEWIDANTGFYDEIRKQREELRQREVVEAEINGISDAYSDALKVRLRQMNEETANYQAELNKQVDVAIEAYTKITDAASIKQDEILRSVSDTVSASQKAYDQLTNDIQDSVKKIADLSNDNTLFDWAQESRNASQQIDAITKRIGEVQLKQSVAFIQGNKKAFDEYNKEIRKLYEARFKLDQSLQKDNEKGQKKQIELSRQIAKAERDAAIKRAALTEKLDGAKPGDRGKIAKQIFDLNQKTSEKVTELRKKQSGVVILDRKRVEHAKDYNTEIDRQIVLYGQLIKKQHEAAEVERQNIINQEVLKDRLKSLFKEFDKFDIGEALAGKDPAALQKLMLDRFDLVEKIVKTSKDLEFDPSGLFRKSSVEENNLILQRIKYLETVAVNQKHITDLTKQEDELQKKIAEQVKKSRTENEKNADVAGKIVSLYERMKKSLKGTGVETELTQILDPSGKLGDSKSVDALRKAILNFDKTQIGGAGNLQGTEQAIALLNILFRQLTTTDEQKAAVKDLEVEWNVVQEQLIKVQEQNKLQTKEIRNQDSAQRQKLNTMDDLIEKNRTLLDLIKQQSELTGSGTPIPPEPKLFAFGGVSGSDNMPALLGKDERVINGRNNRRFFSQLTAMNATPQSVVTGGGSTSVGDINVTMNASGNLGYDMATLGKNIKRAARRGLV